MGSVSSILSLGLAVFMGGAQNHSGSYLGEFSTEPTLLEFCASLDLHMECKSAPASGVPTALSLVMTPKVHLQITDSSTGAGDIVSQHGDHALPAYIDRKQLSLYGQYSTGPHTLYKDPACTANLWLSEFGRFSISPTRRLSLHVDMFYDFRGDCGNTWAELAFCYLSSSCEDQPLIAQFIEPYLRAGVVQIDQLHRLESLGFSVRYE